MTDAELVAELRLLGIDRHSHRVVALLPLVQVAWADGMVQPREHDLILDRAEALGMLTGDGERIVRRWLELAPTQEYVLRGRACLIELARRQGSELGADLDAAALEQVVVLCEQVAAAAGGLFGVLWTVDARERAVITEIARALRQGA